MVREIGEFEKSVVKLQCLTEERERLLIRVIGRFEQIRVQERVQEIGIPLYPCSLLFVYLSKLLFLGFLQFKCNCICGQNNYKYHDRAPFMYSLALSPIFHVYFPVEEKRTRGGGGEEKSKRVHQIPRI